MNDEYIFGTKINKRHIKKYQKNVYESGITANDINKLVPQTFCPYLIDDILLKSYKLNWPIDSYQVYSHLDEIQTTIMLVEEDKKIVAFATFVNRPDLGEHLWQARSYSVCFKNDIYLIGKIYKFCKEILKFSIQSDFTLPEMTKELWINVLPNLKIYPKILDLNNHLIYDNDMSIDIYSKENKKKYCWIIEFNDYYGNQIPKKYQGLLQPHNNRYVSYDNYCECNSLVWKRKQLGKLFND